MQRPFPPSPQMHDFAITEHYSLFLDFPFVFNLRRMMEVANGKRLKPFLFDGVRALVSVVSIRLRLTRT